MGRVIRQDCDRATVDRLGFDHVHRLVDGPIGVLAQPPRALPVAVRAQRLTLTLQRPLMLPPGPVPGCSRRLLPETGSDRPCHRIHGTQRWGPRVCALCTRPRSVGERRYGIQFCDRTSGRTGLGFAHQQCILCIAPIPDIAVGCDPALVNHSGKRVLVGLSAYTYSHSFFNHLYLLGSFAHISSTASSSWRLSATSNSRRSLTALAAL